jgi:hypothetical protein
MDQLAVEMEDGGDPSPAQPNRARGDCVEDRLDIGRRVRKDTQDLAGRGLLLQYLGQRTLYVGIRRRWQLTSLEALEGRTALPTELVTRGVLVLAPSALHRLLPMRRARLSCKRR